MLCTQINISITIAGSGDCIGYQSTLTDSTLMLRLLLYGHFAIGSLSCQATIICFTTPSIPSSVHAAKAFRIFLARSLAASA